MRAAGAEPFPTINVDGKKESEVKYSNTRYMFVFITIYNS